MPSLWQDICCQAGGLYARLLSEQWSSTGDEGSVHGFGPKEGTGDEGTIPRCGLSLGVHAGQHFGQIIKDEVYRMGGEERDTSGSRPGAVVLVDDLRELDPDGLNQHDAGAKLDGAKPDLSLLLMFGKALRAVGDVGTFGARKYSRGGWLSVSDGENRYTAALLRHLFAEDQERYDDDSGKLHAAQVAWNALARLELILQEEGGDDGPDTE